jgi:hypothetical protein
MGTGLAVLCPLALAAPTSAFAHTTLVRTAPASGSVLAGSPAVVLVLSTAAILTAFGAAEEGAPSRAPDARRNCARRRLRRRHRRCDARRSGVARPSRSAPRAALALGGLLLLGATGIVRASFELLHPSQLWDTAYRQTLLVKTGILLVALGAGRLLRARLRRRAAVELVLVAGLVIAVSVLVMLRPGRNVVAVQRAAGASPAALTCSSSSRRHTYQPIASRKTSVCSPFITMPPRFWSRIGESPQRRCVCS